MSSDDDSSSGVSNVFSESSDVEIVPAREVLANADANSSDDDEDNAAVSPAEALANFHRIWDRTTGGIFYRSLEYRAQQAGAAEVRMLQKQVDVTQALITDVAIVQDKLVDAQRINAAIYHTDSSAHRAHRVSDAEALDITAQLQTGPSAELAVLTRELEKAQATQAKRVSTYETWAASDSEFVKETAGGLGDNARFVRHEGAVTGRRTSNTRCCRQHLYPVLAIMINVSGKLTRREIMTAMGCKPSHQGVIQVLKTLVETNFLRLYQGPTTNSTCSYDLNPEVQARFRLNYDPEIIVTLDDLTDLKTRIQDFITEYKAGQQQFRLGPRQDPNTPNGPLTSNSPFFVSPPPAKRRREASVILVSGRRARRASNNEGDNQLPPREGV